MAGQATLETVDGVKRCIDKIEFNNQTKGTDKQSGAETNLHLKKVKTKQITAAEKAEY
jgi:hypothetical protein